MSEFSIRKIIPHLFQVDNNEGESGIGYYMIIGNKLRVQIGCSTDFKRQVFKWGGATVPIKEIIGLISKTDITSREMHAVEMHNSEPVSTREATEGLVKIP